MTVSASIPAANTALAQGNVTNGATRVHGQSASPRSMFNYIEDKIPNAFKLAVLFYVVIYRIISPASVALIEGQDLGTVLLRVSVRALAEFSLVLPLLTFRRCGYLHPLVFPTLYLYAFDIVFQPIHLFLPLVVAANPLFEISPSWAYVLHRLPAARYVTETILLDVAKTLFFLCIYGGFLMFGRGLKFRKKVTRAQILGRNRAIAQAAAFYVMLCILSGWAFIIARGGVAAQIVSFYEGRVESLTGDGVFTVLTKTGSVGLVIWLSSRMGVEKRPSFIILTSLLLPVYWLVDGSRSSVMLLIFSMLLAFCLRAGKIPTKGALVAASFAFLIFGVLGMLRQDYGSSTVNTAAFDTSNASEWVEASRKETSKRAAEEGDLAAFVAARSIAYLDGKTYLSTLAYPIPRALWPTKPKNVYTYNNWVAFLGNSPDTPAPKVYGIPVSPYAEAFWNFGWSGILFVGFMVGIGYRIILELFRSHQFSPFYLALYVESLLYFNGGSRWGFYFIQNSIAIFLVFLIYALISKFSAKFSSTP